MDECEYICNFCKIKFIREEDILEHITKYECEICDFKSCNENLTSTHINDCHPLIPCTLCKFDNRNLPLLIEHIVNYHPELHCLFCDFRTRNSPTLDWHNSEFHSSKPAEFNDIVTKKRSRQAANFDIKECEDCGFRTRYKAALKDHMKMKHRGSHTSICNIDNCKYKTSNRKKFYQHVKSHADKSMCVCPHKKCGVRCRTSNGMQRHITMNHKL